MSVFVSDTNKDEAICLKCKTVFEMKQDDTQNKNEDPPADLPIPVENKQQEVAPDTPIAVQFSKEKPLQIPRYIMQSRAWRWAQESKKTGNPFRESSNSHKIFNIFVEQPRTLEECFIRCSTLGLTSSFGILLTIYETITTCVASGLLLWDRKTGKISVATGAPVPAPIAFE